MKGLLHSKTFKKNLRKWLFMYVGTLCILTSVITYSKYMSSFSGNTEARTAKFNIKVEKLYKCDNKLTETSCQTEATRPLEKYDFYFKVDTTELEVSSLVVITTKANENLYGDAFKINKIEEVDKNGESNANKAGESITINDEGKINYTINPNDAKQIRYYKVEVNHTIQDSDSNGTSNDNALLVGYSAKQID